MAEENKLEDLADELQRKSRSPLSDAWREFPWWLVVWLPIGELDSF